MHRKETEQALAGLTLEEKVVLLNGKDEWESHDIPRLNIPSITFSDGPSGVRRQMGKGDHLGLNESMPATCFPSSATVANSWDPALAREVGRALGEEAAALGVKVLLGPGMNIKRSPLCGRNFEYFSEDPYLAGKLAAGYVQGVQENGVSACVKHFAVNNQETRRMAMNAVVDERTLREIYLTGFEIAIEEGKPGAVMTSYNEVNGEYANENTHLLKEILRGEWGYEGLVVTDWGGSNDHAAGVRAGSDMEMPTPGYDSARGLLAALEAGRVTMEEIDERVASVLDTAFALKDIGTEPEKDAADKMNLDEHHKIAGKAASESIVLLKNNDGILPLSASQTVAIIGDFAREPRYQGAGSSAVNSVNVEKVFEKLDDYPIRCSFYSQGYKRNSEPDQELEKNALEIAAKADVILYFFGLDEISESEGVDRMHMRIPQNQIQLLEKLGTLSIPVVGILCGGAAVEMPWEANCDALLYTGLGGEASASACMDVITGKVNPSGKLAETWPMSYEDTPAFNYFGKNTRNVEYREGIYVGYRYYDKADVPVRYPFGYGLSYTDFAYSGLVVTEKGAAFTITNKGNRDGAEIAQLYVASPDTGIFQAKKELKGFCKVYLKAGESRRVEIPFDSRTFRYWNVRTNRWERESGKYQILIGASSNDLRLNAELPVEGTKCPIPYKQESLGLYRCGQIRQVPDEEFAELLGRKLPEEGTGRDLTVNDAMCQMKMAKSRLARLIYRILESMKQKSEKAGKPDLNIIFIYNMPFRAVAKMTGGMVSMEMADGLVEAVNGHLFRGLKKVIGGYFRNAKANKEWEEKLKGGKESEGKRSGKMVA